ncbi:MAG: hypothetical protein H7X71_01625 [Chitinophagales bacterium]|nr:hypothetical protein [Chitinophagales bacterium]
MKTLCATVLLVSFLHSACIAQVWTSPKNGFYAYASFSISEFNNAYDSAGNKIPLFPYAIENQTVQVYGQYGLTNDFTISLKIPYTIQSSKYNGRSGDMSALDSLRISELNYFGNIEGGVIYKIKKTNPYVTASLLIETNTSDYNFYAGLASGYRSWAMKPGLAFAGTYKKIWYSAYAAGDLRSNDYSSGVTGSAEFGYKPVAEIFMATSITLRSSFENGDYCDCDLIPSGLFFNNQEYVAFTLKGGFQFNEVAINAGYTTAFAGKNIPSTPIVTIGFAYKKE